MQFDADSATAALGALAQSDRLRAFRLLVTTGPSGEASGRIADRLGVPPTRMSFHLAALERSGLVRSWRVGRQVRYAARFATMRGLLIYLAEDCSDGHPEICGDLCDVGPREGRADRVPAGHDADEVQ